jgi:hypothetical protein
MMGQPHGNGSGKIEILATDKGGRLVVYPARSDALPHDLPIHLSRTMEAWFQERPHLRIRSATSIVQDGSTVILHVFYDQVFWPQPTPPQQTPS